MLQAIREASSEHTLWRASRLAVLRSFCMLATRERRWLHRLMGAVWRTGILTR
jgi:hypothetical protein